jgi:hypothetical protein
MENGSIWPSLVKANILSVVLLLFAVGLFFEGRKWKPGLVRGRMVTARNIRLTKIFCKIGGSLLFVALLFYVTIPVFRDTAALASGGCSWDNAGHVEGKVRHSSRFPVVWPLHQSFAFEGKDQRYHVMFNTTLVREGRNYEVYYLPRSRMTLKIEGLVNELTNIKKSK